MHKERGSDHWGAEGARRSRGSGHRGWRVCPRASHANRTRAHLPPSRGCPRPRGACSLGVVTGAPTDTATEIFGEQVNMERGGHYFPCLSDVKDVQISFHTFKVITIVGILF